MNVSEKTSLSLFMWLWPLAFFAYQFILRLWPSLMMDSIMLQFSIDATAFGLLASVYYYGYAGFQIPIAIALERFGPRLIIFLCALICGIATFIFCFTTNWYLALLARFLVGAGSAVGFLGASKVISQWFSRDHYARMIAFTFSFGLLGAIYGGKPVSLLIESFGWQKVAFCLATASITLGVLTYLCLKTPKHHNDTHLNVGIKFADLKNLLRSPTIWFLALANLLMVGALEGFADVWGVNFLMAAYQLNKGNAAELVSFIFVGMLFGGPLLTLLARRLGNHLTISICGLGMAIAFFQIVFGDNNWYVLAFLFFCIGIMCCYQVIVFAVGCEFVSIGLLGITIAFLNCINMLGGAFFHLTVGWVMDLFWTGQLNDKGVRIYTLASYNRALMVIPICAILGAVIVAIIRHKQLKNKASTSVTQPVKEHI